MLSRIAKTYIIIYIHYLYHINKIHAHFNYIPQLSRISIAPFLLTYALVFARNSLKYNNKFSFLNKRVRHVIPLNYVTNTSDQYIDFHLRDVEYMLVVKGFLFFREYLVCVLVQKCRKMWSFSFPMCVFFARSLHVSSSFTSIN